MPRNSNWIFSGNFTNLINDIQELRSTSIIAVPQVLTRIVNGMKEKIEKLPYIKEKLFRFVLNYKTKTMKERKKEFSFRIIDSSFSK
jgi:long-subunit acyl-CoA synthetase (AMP-forming)